MKTDSTIPFSSCLIVTLASFFVLIEISLDSERNFGGDIFPMRTPPSPISASGETIPSSSKCL